MTITAALFPAAHADLLSGTENFRRGEEPGRAIIHQIQNGRIV